MLNEESEGKRANVDIDSAGVKGIMVHGQEISGIQGDGDNYSSFTRLINNQNFMSTLS